MMAPQSVALQRCFDEVADSAPMALERCLNHVVSVLQQAEGISTRATERTELGDAWRELLQHQASWCRNYGDELRTAFKSASREKAAITSVGSGNAKMELSLVDESEIVGAIESSRLVQHVMPLVERPVSELDALVSSAMGLATVRPELNPVRPEVFAQGLRALMSRAQVKSSTGTLWMKYMAEPLGQELQTLYGRLVTQLKDANVQAVGYRVTQQAAGAAAAVRADAPISQRGDPGPRAQGDAPGIGAHANDNGAVYASLSSRQISHTLLREFLSTGGGEQASRALPLSYYAQIDRELASLERQAHGMGDVEPRAQLPEGYRQMPVIARPQRAVGVQSTLDKEVWGEYAHSHERSLVRTRLRRDAKRVAQVLGLELVRKVVNQIAQDPRLLAPVREAIVALEPSLLRLAMVDPRFFSDEKHPGRWMMERVAQRSFKYNDEFSTEFATFFEGVTQCFTGLNASEIGDVQPFKRAISTFESAWAAQDAQDAAPRNEAVDAMKFAELRQLEADRIAWELSSRPDLEGVPSVVQDFVFGPWALVIANARLADRDNQIDPHGYRDAITDLVWSVKPEVTLKQPAQLFARVPKLVGKLREGLASLGQDPEESEPFFQALMKLHKPVLKLRRAKSRRDARESGVAPLGVVDEVAAPLVTEAASTVVPGQPWMSPKELDAAGFEETLPSDMAPLEAAETNAALSEPKRKRETAHLPADPETVLANLREGDWFDLYSKRRWLRAQLIWASTKGTLFMFVSHGGQPHSMTKRICERLIRERVLRPVRMHGVVARALDVLKEDEAAA